MTSETARPGRSAVRTRVTPAAAASGPISVSRRRGPTNRLNSGVAIAVAAAVDASTRPVATGPPPSRAAYGAAIPCGIV
jgi:hypothetical protein